MLKFQQILVPELNSGQLSILLRNKYAEFICKNIFVKDSFENNKAQIITAKNQEESSLYLDSIGAIDVVKNMSEIKEKIIELIQGRGVDIESMIRNSLSICDGAGSERVVNEIIDF